MPARAGMLPGCGRPAHDFQVGLTHNGLTAEVEAVPTPDKFAGEIARRCDQVLFGRQKKLPVHAADPGVIAQVREVEFQRPPARIRASGDVILHAQHVAPPASPPGGNGTVSARVVLVAGATGHALACSAEAVAVDTKSWTAACSRGPAEARLPVAAAAW